MCPKFQRARVQSLHMGGFLICLEWPLAAFPDPTATTDRGGHNSVPGKLKKKEEKRIAREKRES